MSNWHRLFPAAGGVFVVSTSLFMFEILLTRLFSAVMWYHFVTLAVSIALFALALGGILVYSYPLKSDKKQVQELHKWERSSVIGLALSMLILTLALYRLPYQNELFFLYILAGGIPFVFGGIYLSVSFYNFPAGSPYIYFADLLGSAAGSALIMMLLENYSILRTVMIMGAALLVMASLKYVKGGNRIAYSIPAVSVLALVLFFGGTVDNLAKDFKAYQGDPKTLGMLTGNPESIFTTWDSMARTDVVETGETENKIVLVDGGASSYMVPFDGNYEGISYLKKETGYLPFALGEKNNALIIGPGGGRDILFARLAGIKNITAVEVNPGTVEAARKFRDFNGNIYDRPGVNTYIMDGRTFVSRDKKKYDVIYLSLVMTQASEMMGYALSENYIYTEEAFQEYLNHLAGDGILAFLLHGESDLTKTLATVSRVLEQRGIPRGEIPNYLTVMNTAKNGDKEQKKDNENQEKDVNYPLLMVKNKPFDQKELATVIDLAEQGKGKPLFMPTASADAELPSRDALKDWVVTDNKPFFYNSATGAPKSIWSILIIVIFGGITFIYPPMRQKQKEVRYNGLYFALLGISFMLIEIPLLQNFILFFGHPTLTFATVIASLLFAGGLGSFAASFFKKDLVTVVAGLGIALTVIVLNLKLGDLLAAYQGVPVFNKILVVFLVLLPLGFLMGIPFPMGIKRMEKALRDFIPVMWGINGWMSVVGSVGALVLAMTFGFTQTIYTGATGYLLFSLFTFKYIVEKE